MPFESRSVAVVTDLRPGSLKGNETEENWYYGTVEEVFYSEERLQSVLTQLKAQRI